MMGVITMFFCMELLRNITKFLKSTLGMQVELGKWMTCMCFYKQIRNSPPPKIIIRKCVFYSTGDKKGMVLQM